MKKRIFSYDSRSWPDPDVTLSVDQIKQQFSSFFPELSTADTVETKDPADPETTIFEFKRRTGTKGAYNTVTPQMIIAALHNVKEFHIDLIDLCKKMVGDDGKLDDAKLAMNRKEVDEAADQASAYVKATRAATAKLYRFVEKSFQAN